MIYGPREFHEDDSAARKARHERVVNDLLKHVCRSPLVARAAADTIVAYDHILPDAYPLHSILHAVSEVTHILKTDIVGPRWQKPLRSARFLYYYLARVHSMKSFPQIARSCGGRHHSTVMHGCKQVEKNMTFYAPLIEAARARLKLALDRRKMA